MPFASMGFLNNIVTRPVKRDEVSFMGIVTM